jgi:hypothetical protein
MEKKQTAVEWLEEQDNVLTMKLLEKKLTPREFVVQKSKLVDKAKQMEKEQKKLELPTDEEIYELAEKILSVDYLSFTEGAKWMRDKIKGGNNE